MTNTTDLAEVERRLWAAADELRANSTLTAAQYRDPVLGLIFLAFAEHRFDAVRPEVEVKATERRPASADDFRAKGVVFVPENARLSWLVDRAEWEDVGRNVDLAMDSIEAINPDLAGVLPRGYQKLEKDTLIELIRLFAPLPRTLTGDAFGLIYEYFLTNFASSEGRLGGEFFTPQSIVRLIVEVIEPFHGKVYDPACGSGGMFVNCARFVANHSGSPTRDLSVYGQEQKEATVPIGRMNLALHGLSGDIRLANSYYEDLHDAVGQFDFVMANPPFNVDNIDKSKLEGDTRRFPFGLPRPDNGNYLWIQLFRSALNDAGPRRLRDGQLRLRRPRERGRDPPAADRRAIGRRDDRDRLELLLHRNAPRNALVPRPRQARHTPRGHRPLPRRPQHLSPDRPRPPRLPPRADRTPRQHRAALPRRRARDRRGQRGADGRAVPRRQLRRRARVLQGRHDRGDRSTGMEPQPGPLRRHRGRQGGRCFARGDVLFGKIRPYFHKVCVAPVDGIASTDAIVVRPRDELRGVVAMEMFGDAFVAHSVVTSNGTKMPRADWKVLRKWLLPVAPRELLATFEEAVADALDLCITLSSQARAVAKAVLDPELILRRVKDACAGQVFSSGLSPLRRASASAWVVHLRSRGKQPAS